MVTFLVLYLFIARAYWHLFIEVSRCKFSWTSLSEEPSTLSDQSSTKIGQIRACWQDQEPLENCPRIIEKHSIINWYVQVSWVVAFPHWFKRQRHLLDPNWIFLHKYYGFTLKYLITVQHLFNAPITVFFPIEPAGSSFFGGFKIRVILEWGLY